MSATDIIVPSSLPNEMNFALPASLPSAKNFQIRVQPSNQASFTSGQVIQIDVPCGAYGQYLDPSTVYLRFKVVYGVPATGVAGTNFSYLLGSAYSYFNKYEAYANNSVCVDTINEYGLLANTLLQTQLNASDKIGLSSCMGFNANNGYSVLGHKIFDSATGINYLTFEYSIPLIGVIASGCEKMFPIGAINSLRLEWTLDTITNIVLQATALGPLTTYTMSEVEFVGQVIELAPQAQMLIQQQNPELMHIRCNSYKTATNYIAGGTSGLTDILIGTRVSSLKSIFFTFSPSNALEKKYCSVCPNLTQGTSLIVSGMSIPQRGLNCIGHPSDTFCELQKSIGGLSMVNYNGAIAKDEYYRSSTTTGLMVAYNTTLASVTELSSNSSIFILGINTEIVSHRGGLLSGISSNASPMFLRCQIDTAISAYQHTVYAFSFHDIILEINIQAKSMVAKY